MGRLRTDPSSGAAASSTERCVEVGAQIRVGAGRSRGQSPDDNTGIGREVTEPRPDELPEAPLDEVPCHRRSDGLGHDKTDHRPRGGVIGPGRQMHHEGVPSAARASAHRLLEVGSSAHPVRSGQHRR